MNPLPQPPRWADRLLEAFCAPHLFEEIQGDLHEEFHYQVQRVGPARARIDYVRNVLGFLRPFAVKRASNDYSSPSSISASMFGNYLTITWRYLIQSKGYSALNILGLATGMTVALLIGLWVHHQYSYNRFLPDYQRLYQVRRNFNSNGDTLNFPTVSLKLADALRSQIPEMEFVAESDWMGSHGLKVGDKKLYLNGGMVGNDFLKMFQFLLLQGNAQRVLQDPYSIVLTESTAKALFGEERPLGKTVRFDNAHDLKVTGLLKDLPANASFRFQYLVPFSYYEATSDFVKDARTAGFGRNAFQLFAKLKPGVTYRQVAAKIALIEHSEKENENAMNSVVVMQSMDRWRLYGEYVNGQDTDGFIEYVRMFSFIGGLVLLIACINFVNLTTARSAKRAREVGVRKAIGSQRGQLIVQFLTESLLLTLLAFGISLVWVQLTLPAFNALTGDSLAIPYTSVSFWQLMLGFVVLTALVAGSRPAFYLSSFQPIQVLKGTLQVGRAASWPRKILVVAQFSTSVALIIGAVVVYQQIQHAKNRPTGYDVNRLLTTEMNDDLERNFTALKNDLINQGLAERVTTSSSPATNIYMHNNLDYWPGKHAGETVEMGTIIVGDDYFKTMGMVIQEGRDFVGPNDTMSVIFNEMAIQRLQLTHPVGQTITFNERPLRIVGVVKDALVLSPFAPADPSIFVYQPGPKGHLIYRLAPKLRPQEALSKLTSLFSGYSPTYPYNYQFADASYAEKFNQEILIGQLAGLFAGLAIFISCLGLFGLAAYVAEQRTKEIGIRKVLGASVAQVWLLLSKEFIILVLFSCLIACPAALYFLQKWLENYAYRIELTPGVFILASGAAIVITVLTISFQAIKAAKANPVKCLRTE